MPLLRIGHHPVLGEFAHLLADRIERIFEPAGADGGVAILPDQFNEARAARRGIAGGDEMLDSGREPRRGGRRRDAKIGQPDDLALAHRNAAEYLRQKFAGADAHQKVFGLAETAAIGQSLRISRKLADGLDIGGEPGKAVGGALFAVEHPRHRAAFDRYPVGDCAAGIGE